MSNETLELTHAIWKDLAGNYYNDMMSHKDSAISLTRHVDSNVRIAALCVCHQFWKCGCSPEFIQVCFDVAETDSIENTRLVAMDFLGCMFDGTNDRRLLAFLANLLIDPTQSMDVRRTARRVLDEVENGATLEHLLWPLRRADTLEGIDWNHIAELSAK